MKANGDKWRFIEYITPIFIAIGEAGLGLTFILIASLASPLSIPLPGWSFGLLSNLGIGLLAAGIITGTLEPITRKRLQRDIEEIKQAHIESVLKGLMSEPIFREVQAHIIRQPFLRRDFRVTIELSWKDKQKREYLCKSQTVNYDVENVSRTLEDYELYVFEEKVNEDLFPGSTVITEIKVDSLDGREPSVYTDNKLAEYIETTEQLVEARIPVKLRPNQNIRIFTSMRSIHSSREIYPYVLTTPTVDVELTVSHPHDLSVQAVPMHPSRHAFVTEVNTSTLKRWRIRAGILPFQGIETTWRPISPVPQERKT